MQTPEKDLKYYINIAYNIGFFVLVTITFAAYLSFSSLLNRNRWVDHSNQVIQTISSVNLTISQAESAVRGYTITRDSSYLPPYENSTILIVTELDLMDSLVQDNEAQQRRLQALRRHIEDRYGLLEKTIELRHKNNEAELRQFFSARPGRRKMEQIRGELDQIIAEENRLLAVRTAALNRSIDITRYIIMIVLVSTFLIAVFLYLSTRRQMNSREVYTGELNAVNRELATANKELSSVNKELQSSNEEVAASNEELTLTNEELIKAQEKITLLNQELEDRIKQRTADLEDNQLRLRKSLIHSITLNRNLKESENFLSSIIDQSPVSTWIADENGTQIRVNQACLNLFSIPDPSAGIGIYNILKDELLIEKPYYKDIEAVFTEGKIARFSIDYNLIDVSHAGISVDKPVNLIVTVFPIKNSTGKVTHAIIQHEDVSKQIEAQRQFQFLAEFMPQLVWRTKPNGDHDYFNQRWYDFTGLSHEQTKDNGWALVLHPEDYQRTQAIWNHCLATGDSYEIEYRFKRYDGTYCWFLARAFPMRNPQGQIINWFGTCTDIHEQKILVEHLEQSREDLSQTNYQLNKINTDLDNFIYTASHDLKAPITNIEGLTSLMSNRLKTKLTESEKELIHMIELSVARLKQTILDLTEITKVQKDVESSVEMLTFEEVLSDVQTDIASIITTSGALIHTDFKISQIHFARKNLRSILYNLLTNAIKYSAEGRLPEIRISTEKQEEYVLLSVRDNGLGIRPDQLDKIFIMFRRVHTHVEGTGIGLYIVKRIIENNGGKIEVESKEGEGTTFHIYFKEI